MTKKFTNDDLFDTKIILLFIICLRYLSGASPGESTALSAEVFIYASPILTVFFI